jgi:hypothetical protein
LADRNTIVGIFFIVSGAVASGLGYIGAQNVPIAAFGFALIVIGALVLLLVPEPIPKNAYLALFEDSIRNIEIVLEESQLRERAFFVPAGNQIRGVIPLAKKRGESYGESMNSNATQLVETMKKGPDRFIANLGDMRALVLIPPGSKIAFESRERNAKSLELALRRALISFSDLATGVDEVEDEERKIKIQIHNAKLSYDLPYFSACFGSPISCIAACVVALGMQAPVRIVEENFDPVLVRLTLEIFSKQLSSES